MKEIARDIVRRSSNRDAAAFGNGDDASWLTFAYRSGWTQGVERAIDTPVISTGRFRGGDASAWKSFRICWGHRLEGTGVVLDGGWFIMTRRSMSHRNHLERFLQSPLEMRTSRGRLVNRCLDDSPALRRKPLGFDFDDCFCLFRFVTIRVFTWKGVEFLQ